MRSKASRSSQSFDSVGDKALIVAGATAVAGAVTSATVVGLPAGVTAEGTAGVLATTGVAIKGAGSFLSVGAHAVAIIATGNWSYFGPAAFNAFAGILPFRLGARASYFQDKMVNAASDIVGFGKIPQTCK